MLNDALLIILRVCFVRLLVETLYAALLAKSLFFTKTFTWLNKGYII